MSVKVTKTSRKQPPKEVPKKTDDPGYLGELHPLQTLRSEIDAVFDSMVSGLPSMRLTRPSFDMGHWREPFRDPFKRFEDTFGALNKMSPRADIKETDKAIAVTAEMPGVSEADIDVTVADGLLTICAEKKEETRKDEDSFHLSERHYGSIKRTFTLPSSANAEKAKASFKDGVLRIEVPKSASKTVPKKITIKS